MPTTSTPTTPTMPLNKRRILKIAKDLLSVNNTVTTLEIKNKCRSEYPKEDWAQDYVSYIMSELEQDGYFTFSDNGSYRVYSGTLKLSNYVYPIYLPKKNKKMKTKTMKQTRGGYNLPSQRISKTKAFELLQTSGGRFLTAIFTTKANVERLINCRVLKNQKSSLGYVQVYEMKNIKKGLNPIRNINLQTLKEIRLNQIVYKVG